MNRPSLRLFGVSAALLWGAPQVTAQPPVAVPPAPVTPPSAVTVDKIVTDALSVARSAAGRTANSTFYLNSRVSNGLSEKRQNIDLVDVPLRDALKRILEDSKTPYVLDDDVSSEPKISIKLANAPLTTILDALTLSNKIGWRTEFKRFKSAPSTGAASSPAVSAPPYLVTAIPNSEFRMQIHVGKTVATLPGAYQIRTLDIEGMPPSRLQGLSGSAGIGAFGTGSVQTPQMRVYRWQSQKRTFTCPHCHNSISILQQPREVRCSKCHRLFEDNWQVCPYDGTKRPERKDVWRYCPICGKSIKMETSWSDGDHSAGDFRDFRLDVSPSFGAGSISVPSAANPLLPEQWNSETETYFLRESPSEP